MCFPRGCVDGGSQWGGGVNSFFFWEMISENEMEKMLGGHFDGIGGYPDDDRQKLYVSVGERRIILDNKTHPRPLHLGGSMRRSPGTIFFLYVSSCWLLVPYTENTKINLVTIWLLLSLSFISGLKSLHNVLSFTTG